MVEPQFSEAGKTFEIPILGVRKTATVLAVHLMDVGHRATCFICGRTWNGNWYHPMAVMDDLCAQIEAAGEEFGLGWFGLD